MLTRAPLVLAMAIAAASLVASGCAPEVVVHTAQNPAASFDHYRTFAFGAPEGPPVGYAPGASSADTWRRVEPLVAAGLSRRGYFAAEGKGDLLIMVGTGRRLVPMRGTSDPSSDWLPDDENADFVEGAIVIDAFDGKTGRRVWHGASRAEVDGEHVGQDVIRHAVEKLLSSFPFCRAAA